VQALGYFALASTLAYLFSITRARNKEARPVWIGAVAAVASVLSGFAVVAYVVAFSVKAHQFATHGTQSWVQASSVTSSPALIVPQFVTYIGLLGLAVGFVLICMQAMRVGLLTRFMGYLGMLAGALVIIPLVQVPVVQAFWLIAFGALLAGRWPSGVPTAWLTGRAEAWPTSAEMREQRIRSAGGGRRAKPERVAEPEPAASSTTRTRSTTPKRKRKRRR
jgi:hypothetical protein